MLRALPLSLPFLCRAENPQLLPLTQAQPVRAALLCAGCLGGSPVQPKLPGGGGLVHTAVPTPALWIPRPQPGLTLGLIPQGPLVGQQPEKDVWGERGVANPWALLLTQVL